MTAISSHMTHPPTRVAKHALPLAFVLAVLLILAVLPGRAGGAPGDLDPSFGSGGKVTTNLDAAVDVAVDGQDRILVADGSFSVLRYTEGGALDPAFGTAGRASVAFSGGGSSSGLALDAQGRIVVAGAAGGQIHHFALARFNADGSLDRSFGTAGAVTTSLSPSTDAAADVAIDGQGRIVAVGTVYNGSDPGFAIVRYMPTGALDQSFGTGGVVRTDLGDKDDYGTSVAIDPQGRIIVGGYSRLWSGSVGSYHFAVLRYLQNGSLDPAFGAGGKRTTDVGHGRGYALSLDPQGRMILGGTSYTPSPRTDFALARYTSAGTLDQSFAGTGTVLSVMAGENAEVRALAVDAHGRVLAAGSVQRSRDIFDYDFALARFAGSGELDASFGQGGRITADFYGSADRIEAIALDDAGRILVAGSAYTDRETWNSVVALARYLGEESSVVPGADTTAPETAIRKHPAKRTGKRRARFTLEASEAASFEYKLDAKPWKATEAELTVRVKPGKHKLLARATDTAGNPDATPAKWAWKVKR